MRRGSKEGRSGRGKQYTETHDIIVRRRTRGCAMGGRSPRAHRCGVVVSPVCYSAGDLFPLPLLGCAPESLCLLPPGGLSGFIALHPGQCVPVSASRSVRPGQCVPVSADTFQSTGYIFASSSHARTSAYGAMYRGSDCTVPFSPPLPGHHSRFPVSNSSSASAAASSTSSAASLSSLLLSSHSA